MAAGDASVNPASISALSGLIKVKYGPYIPTLVYNGSPFLKRLKKMSGFTKKFGGRQYEFPYEIARGENVKMGTLGSYLPGFSGNTYDDIDTLEELTATVDRARIYAAGSVDGQWLASPNADFFFNAGHKLPKLMQSVSEDLAQELEWQILGVQDGAIGIISGTPTDSGGITTINLQPVSTVDPRGIGGTARFRRNMKLRRIKAAHWASSPTASQADSQLDVMKVSSLSRLYDRSSAPFIKVTGDFTAGGGNLNSGDALADGDVLVRYGSRSETSGGSASGGTLLNMNGILNLVDDGTLAANLYGNSRSTYTELKSQVDLSSTKRNLTWKLLQALKTKVELILDPERKKSMVAISEPGVQDAYIPAEGEAAKRYMQEDKALKVISGFNDVALAFVGNGAPIPWIRYRDFPYGHLFLGCLDDFEALWDMEPGTFNDDGLTLRQVDGKDQFWWAMKAYGQIIKREPMYDGRMSGLAGAYG